MAQKLTKEDFIKRATMIHNNKYDYSKVDYINNRIKVCIICPTHGEFWQAPDKHLLGQGCKKCKKTVYDTNSFIEESKKKHEDKYDYSKVNYTSTDVKVCIICPIHGEFWQTPHMHLSGQGCNKCCKNTKITLHDFVEKAQQIHGNKYDYSDVKFNNVMDKIKITCFEHGVFNQQVHSHLIGHGCPECANKKKYNKNYFIQRAKEVHKDLYDYSLITEDMVQNNKSCVPIICKKHGIFYQTIDNHINGQNGCMKCKSSKLEKDIRLLLTKNNINFEEQKTFEWLKTDEYHFQRLDFFLPDFNMVIECQGLQHFLKSNFGSKKKTKEECFEKTKELDKRKYNLCKQNGIKIIYYSNIIFENYIDKIYTNFDDILFLLKSS